MAAPIGLFLDGPGVLQDAIEGTPHPHKESLIQIDALNGADDVRVPQPCGKSMYLVRDQIALGGRDAGERAMTGQLRFRVGGRVDGFIFDHMRITLDEDVMFMKHGHALGWTRAWWEGANMLDGSSRVEQG